LSKILDPSLQLLAAQQGGSGGAAFKTTLFRNPSVTRKGSFSVGAEGFPVVRVADKYRGFRRLETPGGNSRGV
jgi:hypothetical protein